jgi:hypothetical protein
MKYSLFLHTKQNKIYLFHVLGVLSQFTHFCHVVTCAVTPDFIKSWCHFVLVEKSDSVKFYEFCYIFKSDMCRYLCAFCNKAYFTLDRVYYFLTIFTLIYDYSFHPHSDIVNIYTDLYYKSVIYIIISLTTGRHAIKTVKYFLTIFVYP